MLAPRRCFWHRECGHERGERAAFGTEWIYSVFPREEEQNLDSPFLWGPPRPHPCAAIAGILPQPAPLPSPPPSSAVGSESIPIRGDALRDDALQHLCPHGGAPPFSGLRGADGEAEAVPGAEADGRAAGFDLFRLPEGFPRRTRRQTEVFDGGFAPSRASLGSVGPPPPFPTPPWL